MTAVCTACGAEYPPRDNAAIADKLHEAVAISRTLQALTAHLLWLEEELRGRCTNCTLERAADAFADALPAPSGKVIDLGMRRRP